MVFSSPLFLFLPVTLAVYFALPYRLRNVWLLLTSLVFYAWGEPKFTVVMLVWIGINYVFARAADAWRGEPRARMILAAAIVVNLGLYGGSSRLLDELFDRERPALFVHEFVERILMCPSLNSC